MNGEPLPHDFATDNTEAEQRFSRFERHDPLADIVQPALLNAADIYDYVLLTGMIWPFDPAESSKKLKSASYEVDFLGDLHFVDASGTYRREMIEVGKQYELAKNSITFVYLETRFRLPDYMAARFNLRITHVHAGLLLGTGPLIDPGFAGRLLIPLHNLTSEGYPITGGDGLIWVEFTKLSDNKRWNPNAARTGQFREFPRDKRYREAAYYLEKASSRKVPVPASSSIPGEIRIARESAEKAGDQVKVFCGIGIIGILVTLFTVYTFIQGINVSVHSLVQDALNNLAEPNKSMSDVLERQASTASKVDRLEGQLKELCDREQSSPHSGEHAQRKLSWCASSP